MAGRIVHGSARTKVRVPAGYDKALCGELLRRREVRASGVTCPMCLAVAANTATSSAALRSGRGGGR